METISSADEEGRDSMAMLYEASMEGSVETLNTLIQNDPLILTRISLTSFSETPLHISALLGHAPFAERLLALRPALASQLDSRKRSALHLASANGHAETVKALLDSSDSALCFGRDEDGKIPLHWAAMRGHVGVVELLVRAKPSSVFEKLSDGATTVLHLCVKYNHLEALKLLVEYCSANYSDGRYLLDCKDGDGGNTILHLAVFLNQIETVKYLVSIPGIRRSMTSNMNKLGYKPLDLVDLCDKKEDLKTLNLAEYCNNNTASPQYWRRWMANLKSEAIEWLKSDPMRSSILVAATLIAQMTFQATINPPGGVWQASTTSDKQANCTDICVAGEAVLAYVYPDHYLDFTNKNCNAFLSALYVIFLVASGLPLNNSFCLWMMIVAVVTMLTFTALAFLRGLYLVSPNEILDTVNRLYTAGYWTWVSLLVLVAVFHSAFILVWVRDKLRRNQLCPPPSLIAHGACCSKPVIARTTVEA